jgi:hypothetical protein
MSSTLSATQFEFPADRMPAEPSVDATAPLAADLKNDLSKQPSRGKRGLLAGVRFLIAACIGAAATLAWQSYGEVARKAIASSSEQLGWLAPRAEAVTSAEPEPDTIASAAPAADQQQLESISLDLAAVRQSVDQLIASQEQITRRVDQLAASQEQMTRDITKLQQFQQYILYKTTEPPPQPAPVPVRRPVPIPSPAPPIR